MTVGIINVILNFAILTFLVEPIWQKQRELKRLEEREKELVRKIEGEILKCSRCDELENGLYKHEPRSYQYEEPHEAQDSGRRKIFTYYAGTNPLD